MGPPHDIHLVQQGGVADDGLVAGVGATTLPLQIYSMLKVGVTPEVNAVSTLLLAVTVVLILVAQRLQQPPPERTKS